MKYKKEMKMKGVDIESVAPPPQARHCASPLQLGGSGAHSRECGRGGDRGWLGPRSEARWGSEVSPGVRGGHSCHSHGPGGHQSHATTSQQAKSQEAATSGEAASNTGWYQGFKPAQNS